MKIRIPKLPAFLRTPKSLFLKWALINGVYLTMLGTAAATYKGHIHSIGLLAIGAVLALYAVASAYAGWQCWKDWKTPDQRGVHHISIAIELAPKVAMLGTVGGFLIAFSASTSDIQHRVLGASTGLAATFVGISVMIVLEVIRHLLEAE